jgi:hypothetical protein
MVEITALQNLMGRIARPKITGVSIAAGQGRASQTCVHPSPQLDSNSIEHFPYTARRRWHIDVTQSNATVESINDSVDDSRRRADSAGLTRTLDAQWVGRRRHVMG